MGSPRIVTDQLGAVVARHDYTGFGKDIAETLGATTGGRTSVQGYGASDEVRKQYTGYERDDESGLEFAQARYYNADHGRFTSPDPLTASMNVRNPQTLNRYSYVLNSPYKYTDPLGLLPVSWNSSGGCSAEFSSCDENGRGIGVDEHANRIYQTEVARLQANQAFARGDTERGWQIIRESEGLLQAVDQNGNAVRDPNEPTVTATATIGGISTVSSGEESLEQLKARQNNERNDIIQDFQIWVNAVFGENAYVDGRTIVKPVPGMVKAIQDSVRKLFNEMYAAAEWGTVDNGLLKDKIHKFAVGLASFGGPKNSYGRARWQ